MLPAEHLVAITRSVRADYGHLPAPVPAPELSSGKARTIAQAALRDLFATWGLDPHNPLSAWIRPGSCVVLKPNWVVHRNRSGQGLDCLLTHASLIEAVLDYVHLARPASVTLGDAPVQSCDFDRLREACGLDAIVERFRSRGMNLNLCDFRRTVLLGDHLGQVRLEDRHPLKHFVLFDLRQDSLLEEVSHDADKFRVTMYNPDLLHRTHALGRHQYLIAREVMEADVVLNLPKLKCHRKACITGALKNVVGINGNKEYLPHHRKGGTGRGGDCYLGRSWLKYQAECLLDVANRSQSPGIQSLLGRSSEWIVRCAHLLGDNTNLEGSWYGNDTVWRMSLDLQRILRYGRLDGSLDTAPQRHVISITDAILAGEGDGPFANTPIPAGFLTGAVNPAAAEWVHARLMGFDPEKIPLVCRAFAAFTYPLATFAPSDVTTRLADREVPADRVAPLGGRAFVAPSGWQGHCELELAR